VLFEIPVAAGELGGFTSRWVRRLQTRFYPGEHLADRSGGLDGGEPNTRLAETATTVVRRGFGVRRALRGDER
jgi:hypothetical protein